MMGEQDPKKKKEKIIMYVSAALVLSGLTVTGMRLRNVGIRENDFQLDIPDLSAQTEKELPKAEQYAKWDSKGGLQGAELDYMPEDMGISDKEENTTIVSTGKVKVGTDVGNKAQKKAENVGKKQIVELSPNLENGILDGEAQLTAPTALEDAQLQDGAVNEVILWANLLPEEQLFCAPVTGEILIPYSMEHVVYFPTLDQYKLNSAAVYGAYLGEEVKACAKAQISDIYADSKLGNVIVMNLGGGVEVKYGQLQDVQVNIGQVVEKGETIGTVAEPSRYFSLEGTNVYFAVTRDGIPVDPQGFMGQ